MPAIVVGPPPSSAHHVALRLRLVLHKHYVSLSVCAVHLMPTQARIVDGSRSCLYLHRCLRLWELEDWDKGRSRDVYNAKRMQRVWTCVWTADNNFVLCGSDDCNMRLWKAYSNKPLKKLKFSEQRALEYNDKLKVSSFLAGHL